MREKKPNPLLFVVILKPRVVYKVPIEDFFNSLSLNNKRLQKVTSTTGYRAGVETKEKATGRQGRCGQRPRTLAKQEVAAHG
jgi:hypothetical protein